MFELGITAGSGGIVLLILGTIMNGFRKRESFVDHPFRLVVIVAPFLVLTVEPWLGHGPASFLVRLAGSGLFVFVLTAILIAVKQKTKEKDPWTTADYAVTTSFIALTVLGATWLLVRALN